MDDDLTEMLRNNPPDVVFSAFSEVFFKGTIKMFQRDNEMRSIVLSVTEARDQATRRPTARSWWTTKRFSKAHRRPRRVTQASDEGVLYPWSKPSPLRSGILRCCP